MKLVAPMIAGAAVLALANVALAEEANLASADGPVLLTDAQMDGVTAGASSVSASATQVTLLIAAFLANDFAAISGDVLSIDGPDPRFTLSASVNLP